MPDQLPSAIDPITGQDWTVLQFLQALRLDLSLLTGVDESPGNPDGTGNELLEGNLCPNPVLADNADGWVDLNDGEIERQEITDHIAADYAARVSFDTTGYGGLYNHKAEVELPRVEVSQTDAMTVSVDVPGLNFPGTSLSGDLTVNFLSGGEFVQEAVYDDTLDPPVGVEYWGRIAARFAVPAGVDEMQVIAKVSYTSTSTYAGEALFTAASYAVGDGGLEFPDGSSGPDRPEKG